MKDLLIMLVVAGLLFVAGCSTVKGFGALVGGVGDDIGGLSDAVKAEIGKE